MPLDIKKFMRFRANPDLESFKMLHEMIDAIPVLIEDEVRKRVDDIRGNMDVALEDIKKLSIDNTGVFRETVQEIMETARQMKDMRKGDTGYTPKKGIDYNDGAPGQIPKKGKDYFTDAEIDNFINRILVKIKLPKKGVDYEDGKTPIAGLDYPSEEQIREFIKNEIPATPHTIDEKEILAIAQKAQIAFDPNTQAAPIARALEALKEYDQLDYYALKNRPTIPTKSSTTRPHGGGGLGDVQHETKSVSSATTTIATTYEITGSGYAIWAYYLGQLIMRGTHYTVASNNKTITLLFTPQDGTTIDVIYIR